MGKADNNRRNRQTPVVYTDTSAIPVAPAKCSRTFEDYYAEMQAEYDEAAKNFHATDVRSTEIVRRAAEWAEASRVMMTGHAALFGLRRGDTEAREKALAGMKQCKDDGGIRVDTLEAHKQMVKASENPDPVYLRKVSKAKTAGLEFYFRACSTQRAYLDRYVKDPNYMTPELRAEKKASARAAKFMSMVPRNRIYMPARPFPPFRVPEGEPVPWLPEPYEEWKSQPVSAYYYDTEHDEFALPKGYVSEDGRIDDESVVWNWKDNTVTMKFRGGDPVTWPFWKPKDTFDTMKPGSWEREYYIRLYKKTLEWLDPPGTHD